MPVAPRGSVARSIAVATINGKGKRKGKKGTGKGRTNAPVSRARMSEPVLPISTRARTTEVLLVSRAMRTSAEPSTDIDNARNTASSSAGRPVLPDTYN